MPVNIQQNQDQFQIEIQGEMTIFVAQELKDALAEPLMQAREIEVDLSQVTEIDSAGLQLMLLAKQESVKRSFNLQFVKHSMAVQEILDLTNLIGFFGDPLVIQSKAAYLNTP